ncbi:MAG: GtrA family protein [Hyphomonadaceae bacterium]|nr:GtrA family protein [Hyphomonadaceae bacterium]
MPIERIRRFAASALGRQLARFAVAGVIATAAHYSVLIALIELAHAPPVFSTTTGYCVGIVVSYLLNRRFTFKSDAPVARSFAKYAAFYGVGMVLNGAIFAALLSIDVWYLAAQITATAIVMVWNYFGARFVAFR